MVFQPLDATPQVDTTHQKLSQVEEAEVAIQQKPIMYH